MQIYIFSNLTHDILDSEDISFFWLGIPLRLRFYKTIDQVNFEVSATLKGKNFHCSQAKDTSLGIPKIGGGWSGEVALPRNREKLRAPLCI